MQLENRLLQDSRSSKNLYIDNLEHYRHLIWGLGLILRILFTPYSLKSSHDYYDFRLPVAIGLAKGGGLYNDVHYNNMPIYPYITALAILLVGTENNSVTAVALKLPIAIADSLIPVFVYKIGIRLNYQKEGLMASIMYALNPISILEVQWGRWDGFASLTVVLAFYLMLENRSKWFGFVVGFGFMLKQFPLFIFGIAIVYWRNEFQLIIRSIFVFTLSTILILCTVLLPYNTSIFQMISDLGSHPSYAGYSIDILLEVNCTFIFNIIPFCVHFHVNNEVINKIWLLLFFAIQVYSLLLFYKNPTESNLIEVITLELTLLSLFFINRHTQYTLWLLPWLFIWVFKQGGKVRIIP